MVTKEVLRELFARVAGAVGATGDLAVERGGGALVLD
jgi:hypothetical protein